MPRIPLPDQLDPRSIQGDRLRQQGGEGFQAPGRALQRLGSEISQIDISFKNDSRKIDEYKANLALEKWSNDQGIAYQSEFDASEPDGSGFLDTRTKNLSQSFQAVRKTIRDPELQAKADIIFERVRGSQTLRGMNDVTRKRKSFVEVTTGQGIENAVNTDQITTEDQFNDYFENVVKPKIDSYITDPVEREVLYSKFGSELGRSYLKKVPSRALPKRGSLVPGLSEAVRAAAEKHSVSADYLARLAMVESGGGRNLANASSSARGPFQFIKSTARLYGLSNPMDFAQSADAAARLAKDNASILRTELGREPTAGEMYLAHQQGPKGALDLLLRPDVPAIDILGDEKLRLNGGAPGMTARQFANKWISKFERGNVRVADIPAVKPATGMWQYVDEGDWQSATNKAEAAIRDIERETNASRKQQAEEITKNGYDLMLEDKLTAEWLEENRDSLTPGQYHTFTGALERQEKAKQKETQEKGDSTLYLSLFDRAIHDADQTSVQEDAFLASSQGRITKSDWNRIYSLSQATRRGKARPWLKDIRASIAARLRPSDLEDHEQYSRRLDGLFAFDDFIEANPSISRDEAKKKANEIAKDYAEAVDLRAGLDMPRYTTVGRYKIDHLAIAEAARRAIAASKAGKLTGEALHRETELLRRWMKVLDEEGRSGRKSKP